MKKLWNRFDISVLSAVFAFLFVIVTSFYNFYLGLLELVVLIVLTASKVYYTKKVKDKLLYRSNQFSVQFNRKDGGVFEELTVARRTITIDELGYVSVVDTLRSEQPTVVRWTMCTNAEVERLNNRELLLKQQGKSLILRASKGAKAFVISNDPPHDYDAPNEGSRRVGFEVKVRKKFEFCVKLLPIG